MLRSFHSRFLFSPSGLEALSLNVGASTAFSLIAAAVAREEGAQAT